MRPLAYAEPRRGPTSPEEAEIRATEPIRRVPLEELPGIQPTVFRELDHRIAQTRLEHEPLPEVFLTPDTEEDGGMLVFRSERYDLNITLFSPERRLQRPGRGSGVFVVSNGAGRSHERRADRRGDHTSRPALNSESGPLDQKR